MSKLLLALSLAFAASSFPAATQAAKRPAKAVTKPADEPEDKISVELEKMLQDSRKGGGKSPKKDADDFQEDLSLSANGKEAEAPNLPLGPAPDEGSAL